ncbi:MAG: TolC family protein [Fluviicola sp.]|nr:TolC family protein [Fluviicola sp.]
MKYIYITFLILAVTSCKSVSPAFRRDLKLPETFASNAKQQSIDSLKKEECDTLPSWNKLSKDVHLNALIDSAFQHNIDLQIMDAKVQQVRAGVTFTRGIRLPELQIGLSSGVRKFGDYTIDGVGNYDTQFSPNLNDKQRIPNPAVPDYFMGVHSSWEIDLWGKLKNQKVAAVRRFFASEMGRKLTENELVAEIATTYFFLLTLDEQRLKLQENIQLQERAIHVVEAEFETGRATEVAVHLTRSQLLETQKMLVEVEQEIRSYEIKLSTLSGSYPRAIPRNTLSQVDSLMGELSLTDPEQLLKNRPDIQQAEQLLIASKADLTSARKAFYPTIQLNASMGLQAFRLALLFEPASLAYNVAAGMLLPVLNRRSLKAQLMETSGKQKEAYLNYEKTILHAYSEVYELNQMNLSLDEMILLKNEELTILEESVNSVRELYALGRSTYIEIITTQEYYLETQMELLDLKCRKAQVKVALYKALGGGL